MHRKQTVSHCVFWESLRVVDIEKFTLNKYSEQIWKLQTNVTKSPYKRLLTEKSGGHHGFNPSPSPWSRGTLTPFLKIQKYEWEEVIGNETTKFYGFFCFVEFTGMFTSCGHI